MGPLGGLGANSFNSYMEQLDYERRMQEMLTSQAGMQLGGKVAAARDEPNPVLLLLPKVG